MKRLLTLIIGLYQNVQAMDNNIFTEADINFNLERYFKNLDIEPFVKNMIINNLKETKQETLPINGFEFQISFHHLITNTYSINYNWKFYPNRVEFSQESPSINTKLDKTDYSLFEATQSLRQKSYPQARKNTGIDKSNGSTSHYEKSNSPQNAPTTTSNGKNPQAKKTLQSPLSAIQTKKQTAPQNTNAVKKALSSPFNDKTTQSHLPLQTQVSIKSPEISVKFQLIPPNSKLFKFKKGSESILRGMATPNNMTLLIFFRRTICEADELNFKEIYYCCFDRKTSKDIFEDSINFFLSNYEKRDSKPNSIIFVNFSNEILNSVLEILRKDEIHNETSKILKNLINFRLYPSRDIFNEETKSKLSLAIRNKLLANSSRFASSFGELSDPIKKFSNISMLPVFNEINYQTMPNLEEFDMKLESGDEEECAKFLTENLAAGIFPKMQSLREVLISYNEDKIESYKLFLKLFYQKPLEINQFRPKNIKGATGAVCIKYNYKQLANKDDRFKEFELSKENRKQSLSRQPWFLREICLDLGAPKSIEAPRPLKKIKMKIYQNTKVRGNKLKIITDSCNPSDIISGEKTKETELEGVD